jgi:ABC-type transport system substrate-binding protein
MHRFRLALIIGAIVVAAVFVAGGAASLSKGSSTQAKSGGTVVFGAEQEPPCLNTFLSGCNNTWTSWTVSTQFRGLYIQNPDYSFTPDLAQSAKIIKTKPQTVAVTIKKNAVWSDGVPVTYQDFAYTAKAIVNPKTDAASRSGYDSIKAVTKTSKDGKSFNVVFSKPFAPWQVIFSNPVYPSHALAGQPDFNNVWLNDTNDPKTGKPIADGPFIMTNYTKGQSMTFVRNPKWWGPHKPYLDKVVFVFRTQDRRPRGHDARAPRLQRADEGRLPAHACSVGPTGARLRHQQAGGRHADLQEVQPEPAGAAEPDLRQHAEGQVRAALRRLHVQPLEGRRDHAKAQLHEGLGRNLRLQRPEDVDQVRHDHRQQAA